MDILHIIHNWDIDSGRYSKKDPTNGPLHIYRSDALWKKTILSQAWALAFSQDLSKILWYRVTKIQVIILDFRNLDYTNTNEKCVEIELEVVMNRPQINTLTST